jgi:hypothetical protein
VVIHSAFRCSLCGFCKNFIFRRKIYDFIVTNQILCDIIKAMFETRIYFPVSDKFIGKIGEIKNERKN